MIHRPRVSINIRRNATWLNPITTLHHNNNNRHCAHPPCSDNTPHILYIYICHILCVKIPLQRRASHQFTTRAGTTRVLIARTFPIDTRTWCGDYTLLCTVHTQNSACDHTQINTVARGRGGYISFAYVLHTCVVLLWHFNGGWFDIKGKTTPHAWCGRARRPINIWTCAWLLGFGLRVVSAIFIDFTSQSPTTQVMFCAHDGLRVPEVWFFQKTAPPHI